MSPRCWAGSRIARVHARVAARLPAGLERDRERELARAAAKPCLDWVGADAWTRLGALDAAARQSPDEVSWYRDRLGVHGDK